MKKIISVILLILMLATAIVPLSLSAGAATGDVWVSSSGNDSAAGTESAPVKTLNKAIEKVADGGTITVSGTISVTSWTARGKTFTITGGTVDMSGASGLHMGDNVTFDATTIVFKANDAFYANGYKLVIKENVTVTNKTTIYGGKKGGTLTGSTDITILSGKYNDIYGGSNNGTITGDTNVYIGGNVNTGLEIAKAHDGGNDNFYGGGYKDTIQGGTYITVADSAMAHYVFGGSTGGAGSIGKGSHLYFTGGTAMSLYGGGNDVDTGSGATTVMTGGNVEQVFGGCQGASMVGNVYVKLLGGTITRRVYGGCYNVYSASGGWDTVKKYVTGTVTVIISSSVAITFDAKEPSGSSYNDMALYARSRQSTKSKTETSIVIFIGDAASTKHSGNLGVHDLAGGIMMGGIGYGSFWLTKPLSGTDNTYTVTYSASGNTITETAKNHTGTATFATGVKYTGSAIEPAVTYSNWLSGPLDSITYSNNVNVGTATVTATINGATLNGSFTIANGTQNPPDVSGQNESKKGQGNGKIIGLTTEMEYSTDGGNTYTKVTNPDMVFTVGTYKVRMSAKTNYDPSPAVTVELGAGPMIVVRFMVDGTPIKTIEVAYGDDISESDIPAVPAREGVKNAVWSVTELKDMEKDTDVEAIYTNKDLQSRPMGLSRKNETIAGKNDGQLKMLNTSMEYSDDGGVTYKPVTASTLTLPAGTYYVRYPETDDKLASEPTKMTINPGRMLKVTFMDGESVIAERELKYNESLDVLPEIPAKDGYTQTAPKWDVEAVANVTEDMIVNAIYPVVTPPAEDDTPVVTPPAEDDTPVVTPPVEDDTPEVTPPAEDDTPEVTPPAEDDEPAVTPPEENDDEKTEESTPETEKPTEQVTEKPTEKSDVNVDADVNVDVNVSGCGSSIAGGSALIAIAVAAVAMFKKKED